LVEQDSSATNETIARELHVRLRAQNVQMRTLNVENVVTRDSRMSQNAQAWFEAENLAEGRARSLDVSFVVDDSMYRLLMVIRFRLADSPVVSLQGCLRLRRRLRLEISVLTRYVFPSLGISDDGSFLLNQVEGIVQKARMRSRRT
jgi:hypothetical protein